MNSSEHTSLTVAQMREADRRAIEDLGIPSTVLMDRAGYAVFKQLNNAPTYIVCGKGNNGGDGFVIARYCLLAGYETHVIVLANDTDLSEDAQVFKNVYTQLGGTCCTVTRSSEWNKVLDDIPREATLVDAILGTGIQGEVTGLPRTVIELWPEGNTISVDIPSGLNADTGEACGCAIRANDTVTLQWSKVGFDHECAQPYLGKVCVVDIGIPSMCADDAAWNLLKVDQT